MGIGFQSSRGSAHPKAQLDEDKVRRIRQRHRCGETLKKLAREFGVNPSTISQCVNRKTWIHVD